MLITGWFGYTGGCAVEPLSWDIRLKIAIGAARGLVFLHTLEKKVICRDFNAYSIMLDEVGSQLGIYSWILLVCLYSDYILLRKPPCRFLVSLYPFVLWTACWLL